MRMSPLRQSIVAVTLLGIVAIMICCSSQHDMVTTSEQYEYDSKGRLLCRINPDGSKIKYKYNKQELPIEIKNQDDTVKYGYTANGNRIWMQSNAGKTSYKYDAFDRLIKVVYNYNHNPAKELQYEYDPWNRISSIKISDAHNNNYQVKYEYNILGDLVSIDDGGGRIEYNYSPANGEIVRQLPNGIRTVFSYSPAGELTSIKHSNSQNSLLASYRYEYSPPGKISRVFEETSEGSTITRFEWDTRGYLKNLILPDGKSVHYEYDAMGNRISMKDSKGTISLKYDGFGRLIKAGGTKYEWDGNGNLRTLIDNNDKTRFRYDASNLPKLVKTPNETLRYQWDGDGNMISRSAGKDINYYMPNPLASPGFSMAEFDGTGKLKSSYLYGDSLLGQRDANGRMKYFLEDGFNSIRHISDVNGKIIQGINYTPLSEPIVAKGNMDLDFYMRGTRYLPEIKSYALGGSLYNPQIGTLNQYHSTIGFGYGTQHFGERSFDRAMCLIEKGRISLSQGLTEKELMQREPEYYAMIDDLKNAPDITDTPSLIRLMYFGTPGLIMSHFIRETAIAASFFDQTPVSGVIGVLAKRAEDYFNNFINSHNGGELITGQLAGLQQGENVAKEYSNRWSYIRGLSGAFIDSMDQIFKLQLSPITWVDTAGQFRMDRLVAENSFNVGKFFKNSIQLFVQDRVTMKMEDLIGGESKKASYTVADENQRKYNYGKQYFKGPDWPDGGGGGGGGPGGLGGPFRGGFYDPFKSMEAKLGGIKLDATAQFTGSLLNITGAVYDPEKQLLVLVGDENASLPLIKAEDLAVAVMLVYGPTPQDAQFTLDPDDPLNPRGKWLKAVYMPEQIIGGTEFGNTLYEADWLLKQYSFGVTLNSEGKIQERKSSVTGFKSVADLSYERKDSKNGKESWNRFWIVSDDMKLKQSGRSIYFDSAKMRVKAKKQVPDPRSPTGLKDVDSEDDPVATKFAKGFTDRYDEIAKESPEFERVRQLAKAVAIAKWMKQEGIPFDTGWVNEYANKRVDTVVRRVTALSTQWEKRNQTPFQRGNQSGVLTQIHKIHLFGGVDLTVKPKFISDDGNAQKLKNAVMAKLREKVVVPTFDVNHNGKVYRAVILPVTSQGQAVWKNSPTITINGTRYQFNKRGDVANSTDTNGNVTKYTWAANYKLDEFKIIANDGWLISGKKKNNCSEITAINPLQNNFLYRYAPTGYLNEVIINGQRYAIINYDGKDVTIDYGNYLEQIKYNSTSRIERYEIGSLRDGVPSGKPQVLNINYDKDGYPTEIYTPDTEHIKLAYSDGSIRTVVTSRGKVDYLYEAQTGRISQINTTWGESQRYDYVGSKLTQITTKKGDYQKDIIFKDNLPVEVKDNNGGSTKYKYNTNGLIEQVTDPTGATGNYSYDGQNRIRTINLPDGSSYNIQYEWYSAKDAKETAIKKIVITQAISKMSSSPLPSGSGYGQ